MASNTRVHNTGVDSALTLPPPYQGVVGPGRMVIVPDTIANVMAAFTAAGDSLGGAARLSETSDAATVAASGARLDIAATWTALQKFGASLLAVLNAAGTFFTKLTSLATANRTATLPDKDFTFAGIDDVAVVADQGVVAAPFLDLAAQPTATDTFGIGADVYEFIDMTAVPPKVSVDSHIGVPLGALAADTQASVIAAVNGTATNPSTTIFKADGVTGAQAIGTNSLLAVAENTSVAVQSATAIGGTPIGANPNLALTESITAAADIWNVGNVNMNTLGGRVAASRKQSRGDVTVTANMIANGFAVAFPFTPSRFSVQARSSGGVIRGTTATDTFALAGNVVVITPGGGALPNMQATDVLTVAAEE